MREQKNREWRMGALIALLLIPFLLLTGRAERAEQPAWGRGFSIGLEDYVKGNVPFSRQLQELALQLRLWGGMREQNGIFISNTALMRNLQEPEQSFAAGNTSTVLGIGEYARDVGIPVYLALIPTACAIQQEELPSFAQTFNQRQFIEETYASMYGQVSTVDLYTALFANRGKQLYYRTEDNLTAVGGYHVYDILGERLGITERTLSQYDVSYASNSYYGELYRISPHKNVRADVLPLYRHQSDREHLITHFQGGARQQYHTLYPTHLLALGKETDCYLGGLSAVVRIQTTGTGRSLLVFGDKTAQAYLPFLSNHYGEIVFVDLSQDPENYNMLRLEDYEQVLFAYSVDTFLEDGTLERVTALLDEERDFQMQAGYGTIANQKGV